MIDFAATKALFHIPDGVIYLDGNSLGAMPKSAAARAKSMISDEWGEMLIRGWNDAGWMEQPKRVGDLVARLIGAAPGTVVMGDTLSIKVYQALASALEMNPDRKVVVSDNGNFPTDLYIADGLIKSLDKGHVLKTPNPEDVESLIKEDLAVLMLTHVDYRTGRMYDMKRITTLAHEAGAIVIWDLAHSAGAVPVDLAGCEADFAVGCTYKYLNGGPGAPAFIYVRPDHAKTVRPALSGWLGHAAPFAFDLEYSPAPDVSRMRVGTPPVIQMTVLEEAMKAWDGVEMADIRARSIELCDQFIAGVEASCPMLELASPRDANKRGSQVSFRFENGYAVMQALIARGVIGDFRAPDIIRFGFTPLYIDNNDVDGAVKILAEIMETCAWDKPEFHKRNAVT
ncbi:kynureninase [Thalassospira xianhensis]|uniref:Kynureninase n=1 Tax=Thalassospira xianhensis MCCC 1A02616 TaxID=1177929 RepID=A0A367U8E7_9PROT|nr:kynureninase [Thalassospira xianhensis]RCK04003.1 kynureninase [Thalassospira xianhensis MCCC 1A02616]